MLKSIPTLVNEIKENITVVTAQEALNMMKSANGTLIDVREPAEITHTAIEGAVNIPRGVLEMKIGGLCPQANQPIYIHCASGVRAMFAAEQLQRIGSNNVKAITCAIKDIQAAAVAIN